MNRRNFFKLALAALATAAVNPLAGLKPAESVASAPLKVDYSNWSDTDKMVDLGPCCRQYSPLEGEHTSFIWRVL